MFGRFDHVAAFSHDYTQNAKFYQALFGLKELPHSRARGAILLSDGSMGYNHVPVRTGFPSGLNHFGIQVEDVKLAIERIRKFDPTMDVQDRPPTRNIIAYSAHDPDGNIFDLAQRDKAHDELRSKDDLAWEADRRISHYAIRTRDAARSAAFFTDVFELSPVNSRADDANIYVTDGTLTLTFVPWSIKDYAAQDALRPAPDHLGVRVESIDQLKKDIDEMVGRNPHLRPWPIGGGSEGDARLELFKRASPYATYHMTDIEGVHLAVWESDRRIKLE